MYLWMTVWMCAIITNLLIVNKLYQTQYLKYRKKVFLKSHWYESIPQPSDYLSDTLPTGLQRLTWGTHHWLSSYLFPPNIHLASARSICPIAIFAIRFHFSNDSVRKFTTWYIVRKKVFLMLNAWKNSESLTVMELTVIRRLQFWFPSVTRNFVWAFNLRSTFFLSLYQVAKFHIETVLHVVSNLRVVSISCSPTGMGFVCSATTAPKSHSQRVPSSTALSSETSNITGSTSGVLQYWDIKAQKMEQQLPLDPVPTCVNCTTFNHNGTLLVSGASDGMIRLFGERNEYAF